MWRTVGVAGPPYFVTHHLADTAPMKKNFLLVMCVSLLAPASFAIAEVGDWYLTPAAVYTDDDGDRNIDDSLAGGQLSLGRQVSDHFDVEGVLGYSDIAGFPGQEHLEAGLNIVGHLAPFSAFSPYLIAGAGYLGTETTTGITDDSATGTFGAGFRWRLGDSRVSIRGEYKGRVAFGGDDNLTDRIGTLGLQFSFGAAALPVTDTDIDGVPDYADRCPGSDPGVLVDSVGCEVDSDGDGVPDSRDACSDTPADVEVDEFGCRNDSDSDGVSNDLDRCPGTAPGIEVDAAGCERDDDDDGVANRFDDCPDTLSGVRVDVHGCEIRAIIELQGVTFASNSDILLPGSEAVLTDAVATLLKYPELQIEVAGYTDSDGAANFNLGLSQRRAFTVRDYLINAGVDPTRLSARGYGETTPLSDNDTATGKAANRRVELRILDR